MSRHGSQIELFGTGAPPEESPPDDASPSTTPEPPPLTESSRPTEEDALAAGRMFPDDRLSPDREWRPVRRPTNAEKAAAKRRTRQIIDDAAARLGIPGHTMLLDTESPFAKGGKETRRAHEAAAKARAAREEERRNGAPGDPSGTETP